MASHTGDRSCRGPLRSNRHPPGTRGSLRSGGRRPACRCCSPSGRHTGSTDLDPGRTPVSLPCSLRRIDTPRSGPSRRSGWRRSDSRHRPCRRAGIGDRGAGMHCQARSRRPRHIPRSVRSRRPGSVHHSPHWSSTGRTRTRVRIPADIGDGVAHSRGSRLPTRRLRPSPRRILRQHRQAGPRRRRGPHQTRRPRTCRPEDRLPRSPAGRSSWIRPRPRSPSRCRATLEPSHARGCRYLDADGRLSAVPRSGQRTRGSPIW